MTEREYSCLDFIIEFYKRRKEKPVNINGVPLTAQTENETQNVLTDNNPRCKQQGILSLTQDKMKVCSKPEIELNRKGPFKRARKVWEYVSWQRSKI